MDEVDSKPRAAVARTLLIAGVAALMGAAVLFEVAAAVNEGVFERIGLRVDSQVSPILFSFVAGAGLMCGLTLLFRSGLAIARLLSEAAR